MAINWGSLGSNLLKAGTLVYTAKQTARVADKQHELAKLQLMYNAGQYPQNNRTNDTGGDVNLTKASLYGTAASTGSCAMHGDGSPEGFIAVIILGAVIVSVAAIFNYLRRRIK